MGEVQDETTEERAARSLEARVVMLEGDVRAMETRHMGIAEDVRWLREREERVDERSARRWTQMIGCMEAGIKSVVEIIGGLLGSAPIRWALAAALVTAVPGATGAIALMQAAGPALVQSIRAPEPTRVAPAPHPANHDADTDGPEPLPPLGGP